MMNRTEAFSVGDRVRVSGDCWNQCIRGAVGVISEPPSGAGDKSATGVFWVEFDQWIAADDAMHPIEASEVGAADLERLP